MQVNIQPMATAAMSSYVYTPEFEALFEATDRFRVKYQMSRRDGGTLWVPRAMCPLGAIDARSTHHLGAINCKHGPRDDQPGLIAHSIELLKNDQSHILQSPTGSGKTYMGSAIACAVGEATLIVVTKSDLMAQWRDTLLNLVGVTSNDIGLIQGPVEDWKGKRFVLAMVQSLVKSEKRDPDLYKAFGLLILDEVHRMAADTFVRTCELVTAKYRLGLSATPKRGDGKMTLVHAHIGPTLVVGVDVPMKAKVLVQATGWRIPRVKRLNKETGEMEEKMIPHQPGRMIPVYKPMASNAKRNVFIVDFVVQAYNAGRRILLIGEMIDDHLKPMFHLLAKRGIPGEDMGFYISGLSEVELKINANKRVVFATWGMVSEGTDYPIWDTGCAITPRANVTQAIGRITRKREGKKQPVWLDLVDADKIFDGYFRSRQKQYYELKHEMVYIQ